MSAPLRKPHDLGQAKRVDLGQRRPIDATRAAKLELIVEDRRHAAALARQLALDQPIDAAR
jgi:hypothetical protein